MGSEAPSTLCERAVAVKVRPHRTRRRNCRVRGLVQHRWYVGVPALKIVTHSHCRVWRPNREETRVSHTRMVAHKKLLEKLFGRVAAQNVLPPAQAAFCLGWGSYNWNPCNAHRHSF